MTGWRDPMLQWLVHRSVRSTSPAATEPLAALPAPDGESAPGEPEMAELVARMRVAARHAGIDEDGPLTPLLEAFMLEKSWSLIGVSWGGICEGVVICCDRSARLPASRADKTAGECRTFLGHHV